MKPEYTKQDLKDAWKRGHKKGYEDGLIDCYKKAKEKLEKTHQAELKKWIESEVEEMNEVCTDNRFELIEKYKNRIIKSTNIETCKEEMKVIDNILFRLWQMGWLDILEDYEKENEKKEIMKNIYQLEQLSEYCRRQYNEKIENDWGNETWKEDVQALRYAIGKLKEDYSKLESEVK